ncbi:hypothetical protein B9Z55_000238 [Caenorhabditis nigoni]|uniref:SH2 domain-containing protein n=1 Tax=Caenorhabditis nigoni TaxID=1611254 RepID=A0A2G5VKF4_9PELO|nr:hypothetical protein B9Z55_000238 [Caenorhabditis nigoni]
MSSTLKLSHTIIREGYYHGLLPREDAAALLTQNGDFLIRISEPTDGADRNFILSCMTGDRSKSNDENPGNLFFGIFEFFNSFDFLGSRPSRKSEIRKSVHSKTTVIFRKDIGI